MTEHEIRNMQPGPEMDILLEVELFGKVRGGAGRQGLVGDGRYYSYPRQLSRTWEGMGLVVKEIQRRELQVYMLNDSDGTVFVQVVKGSLETLGDAQAPTAPHAVAMAALLALLALRGGEV